MYAEGMEAKLGITIPNVAKLSAQNPDSPVEAIQFGKRAFELKSTVAQELLRLAMERHVVLQGKQLLEAVKEFGGRLAEKAGMIKELEGLNEKVESQHRQVVKLFGEI